MSKNNTKRFKLIKINHATLYLTFYQLVESYDRRSAARKLLRKFDFYLIPVLNPDGYAYTWNGVSKHMPITSS